MKESTLQKKVKLAISNKFPKSWYYHPIDRVRRGIPDILLILNGQAIAIELKKQGNAPTLLQRHTLLRIQKAGGYAFWADNVEDVHTHLDVINKDSSLLTKRNRCV